MAKVICALLRYTDDEKTSIMEHEKARQTVNSNALFSSPIPSLFFRLALVKYIKITPSKLCLLQFFTQGTRTY